MQQDCVLVLEPDVLVRHPLSQYLRDCGYRVLEAVSYGEARAVLCSSHPPDAVLTNMAKDAEAFAFAIWARQNYPRVVLLLGGGLAKVAGQAGDLCEDRPAQARPVPHHGAVLERIRRSLATRERNSS